jgi:hypothetical protein
MKNITILAFGLLLASNALGQDLVTPLVLTQGHSVEGARDGTYQEGLHLRAALGSGYAEDTNLEKMIAGGLAGVLVGGLVGSGVGYLVAPPGADTYFPSMPAVVGGAYGASLGIPLGVHLASERAQRGSVLLTVAASVGVQVLAVALWTRTLRDAPAWGDLVLLGATPVAQIGVSVALNNLTN